MAKPLSKKFFCRPAPIVAPELLGCYLVRRWGGNKVEKLLITETEAYDGQEDLANHASRGRSVRTEVMFNSGGVFYVYLIYGMYYMLNVVVDEVDRPAAVLIRGTDRVSGPGRLGRYLNINKDLNGQLAEVASGIWFEKSFVSQQKKIKTLPRVGVEYAGVWASKPYRYLLE